MPYAPQYSMCMCVRIYMCARVQIRAHIFHFNHISDILSNGFVYIKNRPGGDFWFGLITIFRLYNSLALIACLTSFDLLSYMGGSVSGL